MRLLYLLVALLAANAAWAQRPNTTTMTCAQAQNLVASAGAILLSTGRHTFDRFVAAPGYCLYGDYALDAYAPTRDNPRCRIGYRCESTPPFWEDHLFD